VKQVIVVNEALRLPRGKLAAQAAHAALAAFLEASEANQRSWLEAGMPKVVLHGEDEALLHTLLERARRSGLAAALIRDAGRTVLAAGTVTCLGIGPAEEEQIDALTGALRLLR